MNYKKIDIVKGDKNKHLDIWKEWLTSEYVMQGFDYRPKSTQDLDEWFDKIIIYFLELDGVPIGMVDIYKSDTITGEAEVGYLILSEYTGNGYAQMLLKFIIGIAKEMDYKSIVAYTVKENVPSQKVLTNNGFEFIGEKQESDDWSFYNKPQPWNWYKLKL